jgi:hypothetical protein
MKNFLPAIFLIFLGTHSFAQDEPDYSLDFDFFAISLGLNDSAAVRHYFESDSAYKANVWDIFEPEFVKAIDTYTYKDLTDSYIAGEKVKQLELTYDFSGEDLNGEPFSGTTTIYVFFQETPAGLKFVELFRPEGTDAP